MSLRSLMIHTVDVERKTITKDASGGKVDTWSTRIAGMRCRVEPASSGKLVDFDKLGMKVSHVIYTDATFQVKDLDRVKFTDRDGNTRYFEVQGAKDVDEWHRFSEIWAQEIRT